MAYDASREHAGTPLGNLLCAVAGRGSPISGTVPVLC